MGCLTTGQFGVRGWGLGEETVMPSAEGLSWIPRGKWSCGMLPSAFCQLMVRRHSFQTLSSLWLLSTARQLFHLLLLPWRLLGEWRLQPSPFWLQISAWTTLMRSLSSPMWWPTTTTSPRWRPWLWKESGLGRWAYASVVTCMHR